MEKFRQLSCWTRERREKIVRKCIILCSAARCCSAAVLQICTQSHRADECNEMSIFLEIHMCENDPRLPNSTCIENLKRPQFPQRKPHSVHFSKIEYAILILTLIHENFSAALEFLPLVYSVSSIFCIEISINVLLFISDGASNSSPQIPSSRIRKSKSLFLPIKNILTEPENTVLAPDTDELVAE